MRVHPLYGGLPVNKSSQCTKVWSSDSNGNYYAGEKYNNNEIDENGNMKTFQYNCGPVNESTRKLYTGCTDSGIFFDGWSQKQTGWTVHPDLIPENDDTKFDYWNQRYNNNSPIYADNNTTYGNADASILENDRILILIILH